jgi:hypothetical protein
MARTLPTTVVNALFAQQTSQAYLVLLQASHSAFTTVRIVNNTEGVTSNSNLYAGFPFAVILPPDKEDLTYQARIVIYDAEREIIDNLRLVAGLRERIKIRLAVVSTADYDDELQTISGLEVVNVGYTAGALTVECSIDNFLTEGFPRDSFTPGNFPGLF